MKVIEGEFEFVFKYVARVLKSVCDDASLDVIFPEYFVQEVDAKEGCDTKLSSFENDVALMLFLP